MQTFRFEFYLVLYSCWLRFFLFFLRFWHSRRAARCAREQSETPHPSPAYSRASGAGQIKPRAGHLHNFYNCEQVERPSTPTRQRVDSCGKVNSRVSSCHRWPRPSYASYASWPPVRLSACPPALLSALFFGWQLLTCPGWRARKSSYMMWVCALCRASVSHAWAHPLSACFSPPLAHPLLRSEPPHPVASPHHQQWKFSMRAKDQDESSNFVHLQYSPISTASRVCVCLCACACVYAWAFVCASVSDSRILMKFYSVHIAVNVISAARLVLSPPFFMPCPFVDYFVDVPQNNKTQKK